MREILFRGKRKDNGEWVEGFLFQTIEHTYIAYAEQFDDDLFLSPKNIFIEVIPETVGQYTGLTDKNGKKIFEGDIVKKSWTYHYYVNHQKRSQTNTFIGQIVLDSGSYIMKEQGEFIGSSPNGEWLEVIGNIHDNPDLLKGGE